MEDPTANEFDLDFQVEEAWEFAAPQFYDFGDPAADDKAADRWFGTGREVGLKQAFFRCILAFNWL